MSPAGSVIVQGDLVGITKHDIKAGVLGAVSVEGVFRHRQRHRSSNRGWRQALLGCR